MMDTEKGRTSGAGSEEGGECGHLGYSLGMKVFFFMLKFSILECNNLGK